MCKIPVLIIGFNRPEHVKKAIEAVSHYAPNKIYLACDGARANVEGEEEIVETTRRLMEECVDWPCEVFTLFHEENLGCAYGPYTAISWLFEHEEVGIIIEDDVIVGLDFFKLCEDLLVRYANDVRVMEISARNHSGRKDIDNSYVYTQYMQNWGWATWRRAWKMMDMSMDNIKQIGVIYMMKRTGIFRGLMMYYYFWLGRKTISNSEVWDTRWYLSIMVHDGLIISPGVNLALNIGIGGGTHYWDSTHDPYWMLKIGKVAWPIIYNDSFVVDREQAIYDNKDFARIRMMGIKKKIKRLFRI